MNRKQVFGIFCKGCLSVVCLFVIIMGSKNTRIRYHSPNQSTFVELDAAVGADEHDKTAHTSTDAKYSGACPASLWKNDRSGMTNDFNLCTRPHIMTNKQEQHNNSIVVVVETEYQCAGDIYERFSRDMKDYASELISQGQRTPCWGHRVSVVPPNMTVLAFGNSHTKQTAYALMCQAQDQIVSMQSTILFDMDTFVDVRFANGGRLVLLANSPVSMAVNLRDKLEEKLNIKLDDFDAMILGVFNRCFGPYSFVDMMREYKGNPEYRFDDCEAGFVPTFQEVANVYDGPILFVSMFANYTDDVAVATEIAVREYQNQVSHGHPQQTTYAFQHGREHVTAMDQECGSDHRREIGDCENNAATAVYQHRCNGMHGGHADLIAYDVSEFLYSLS